MFLVIINELHSLHIPYISVTECLEPGNIIYSRSIHLLECSSDSYLYPNIFPLRASINTSSEGYNLIHMKKNQLLATIKIDSNLILIFSVSLNSVDNFSLSYTIRQLYNSITKLDRWAVISLAHKHSLLCKGRVSKSSHNDLIIYLQTLE